METLRSLTSLIKQYARQFVILAFLSVLSGFLFVSYLTYYHLRPFPPSLALSHAEARKKQVLDRHGTPLSVTFQND